MTLQETFLDLFGDFLSSEGEGEKQRDSPKETFLDLFGDFQSSDGEGEKQEAKRSKADINSSLDMPAGATLTIRWSTQRIQDADVVSLQGSYSHLFAYGGYCEC